MDKKTQTVLIVGLIVITISVGIVIYVENNNLTGNIIGSVFKNCENVRVPYQDTETYVDYLNSEVDYANNQEKIDPFGKWIYQEGIVSLKNIDNEEGWFTVKFNWRTLNDQEFDEVRHYIEPDESVEFISIFDTSLGEDNEFTYTYISDPVQKTRIVTKYRTERVCD